MSHTRPMVKWTCDGCGATANSFEPTAPARWRRIEIMVPHADQAPTAPQPDIMNTLRGVFGLKPEKRVDYCPECFLKIGEFLFVELAKKD